MSQLSTINHPGNPREITEVVGLNPLQPVSDALGRIFTTNQEENRMQQTRRIMGDLVSELPDEELEGYITEFQYLIDEWLLIASNGRRLTARP